MNILVCFSNISFIVYTHDDMTTNEKKSDSILEIGENTFVASTLTNTITNLTQDIIDPTDGTNPLVKSG